MRFGSTVLQRYPEIRTMLTRTLQNFQGTLIYRIQCGGFLIVLGHNYRSILDTLFACLRTLLAQISSCLVTSSPPGISWIIHSLIKTAPTEVAFPAVNMNTHNQLFLQAATVGDESATVTLIWIRFAMDMHQRCNTWELDMPDDGLCSSLA